MSYYIIPSVIPSSVSYKRFIVDKNEGLAKVTFQMKHTFVKSDNLSYSFPFLQEGSEIECNFVSYGAYSSNVLTDDSSLSTLRDYIEQNHFNFFDEITGNEQWVNVPFIEEDNKISLQQLEQRQNYDEYITCVTSASFANDLEIISYPEDLTSRDGVVKIKVKSATGQLTIRNVFEYERIYFSQFDRSGISLLMGGAKDSISCLATQFRKINVNWQGSPTAPTWRISYEGATGTARYTVLFGRIS